VDSRGFNWLNFTMPLKEQRELFIKGAEAGIAFLET
jgi:hypothetical protein